ncbi:MAG: glycosyltransferase family 8 protein [Bacteroidaceae bacterium]|nr:glycosyltransferase family 8 protein [Bacteroidaceae bacterium]
MLYLCYSINDLSAMPAGISLMSFLENNPDYEPEEVFFLDYGIRPANKQKLDSIATHYGRRITYLKATPVTNDIKQRFPHLGTWRYTMAPNAKPFMDQIVPEYVERLLFIDADTLVTGSVSDLMHLDMEGAALAAVPQCWESYLMRQGVMKLYSGSDMYFNSGVLLYDLNTWRREDCHQMVIDTLQKKKQFYSPDQTLLNNAIPGRLQKQLPLKYNNLTHWLHPRQELKYLRTGNIHNEEEIQEAIDHPVIIHYTGGDHHARPWHKGCRSRRQKAYQLYWARSPWKDVPPFPPECFGRPILSGIFIRLHFWLMSKQPYSALSEAALSLCRFFEKLEAKWYKAPPPMKEGIEE